MSSMRSVGRRGLGRWAVAGVIAAALAFIAATPESAPAALTLTFDNITLNNATDAAAGEAQLRVDLDNSNLAATTASFTFYLVAAPGGFVPMSITDVYFDDGTILGSTLSIVSSSGVSFSQGATPGNLPSGNSASPPFVATVGYTADSNPPVAPNGVDAVFPTEFLTINLALINSQTVQDVIDDLQSGVLRIGLHVQGFAGGGSESYVNNPPNGGPGPVVPEPSTLVLAIGCIAPLAAIGLIRRRRQARAEAA